MYNICINVHLHFLHSNIQKQIILFDPSWIINPVEYKQCILDQRPSCTPVKRVITSMLSNSSAVRWQKIHSYIADTFIFNTFITVCFR